MIRKVTQNDKDIFFRLADEFYRTDTVDKPVLIKHHVVTHLKK